MSKHEKETLLVDVDWLKNQLSNPNLILLDASANNPTLQNTDESALVTIPGARHFDIDGEMSDHQAPFPHTMLSPDEFTQRLQALGVNNDSVVVVFDNAGIFSSPRAWWMLNAMGHEDVRLLNGGLPAWLAANQPTAQEYALPASKGNFIAVPKAEKFVNINDVKAAIENSSHLIVDARSAERFNSLVDEPRPNLRRGNIPTSINLPFATLLNQGFYKPFDELKTLLAEQAINADRQIVFSCGSGLTACINAFAATLCGHENVSVYDGSWTEWGTIHPQ